MYRVFCWSNDAVIFSKSGFCKDRISAIIHIPSGNKCFRYDSCVFNRLPNCEECGVSGRHQTEAVDYAASLCCYPTPECELLTNWIFYWSFNCITLSKAVGLEYRSSAIVQFPQNSKLVCRNFDFLPNGKECSVSGSHQSEAVDYAASLSCSPTHECELLTYWIFYWSFNCITLNKAVGLEYRNSAIVQFPKNSERIHRNLNFFPNGKECGVSGRHQAEAVDYAASLRCSPALECELLTYWIFGWNDYFVTLCECACSKYIVSAVVHHPSDVEYLNFGFTPYSVECCVRSDCAEF